jgi:hypothetical protein
MPHPWRLPSRDAQSTRKIVLKGVSKQRTTTTNGGSRRVTECVEPWAPDNPNRAMLVAMHKCNADDKSALEAGTFWTDARPRDVLALELTNRATDAAKIGSIEEGVWRAVLPEVSAGVTSFSQRPTFFGPRVGGFGPPLQRIAADATAKSYHFVELTIDGVVGGTALKVGPVGTELALPARVGGGVMTDPGMELVHFDTYFDPVGYMYVSTAYFNGVHVPAWDGVWDMCCSTSTATIGVLLSFKGDGGSTPGNPYVSLSAACTVNGIVGPTQTFCCGGEHGLTLDVVQLREHPQQLSSGKLPGPCIKACAHEQTSFPRAARQTSTPAHTLLRSIPPHHFR